MTNKKRALITGIFGQDGSYLTELLLSKGYEVGGLVRAEDRPPKELFSLYEKTALFHGNVLDRDSIVRAVTAFAPNEVYNLASPSSIGESLEYPVVTSDAIALGPVRILEVLRAHKPDARFFQASSQEIFGDTNESPQDEETVCRPRNPYGAAKLYAHTMVDVFRKQFGMYAVSGILYNHESPRRGDGFVTKKIAEAAVKIKHGLESELSLGDLSATRDWGYAGDYVEAMRRMLQREKPEDFLIATGVSHTVQDFVEAAFGCVALDWKKYVRVDPTLIRRPDLVCLVGNTTKARAELDWKPRISFHELVAMMVGAEVTRVQNLKQPAMHYQKV